MVGLDGGSDNGVHRVQVLGNLNWEGCCRGARTVCRLLGGGFCGEGESTGHTKT